MKKNILLLFIILLFFNCKSNYEKEIIGKWICISSSYNQYYEFKTDHKYTFKVNDFLTLEGIYKVIPEFDSLILYSEGNQLTFNYIFKIKNNQLFLTNYKKHGEIDEVSLLNREGNVLLKNRTIDDREISSIILPNNYIGFVYLCYNQEYGQNKEFDDKGNPIIRIPFNGLCKTQLLDDHINYVQGKFLFIEEASNNLGKKLPFFFFTENIGRLDNILSKGFNMNSVYVCIYGYNQTSRDEINKLFSQPINGNVLMFRVDTLKNMIANPFLGTRLTK